MKNLDKLFIYPSNTMQDCLKAIQEGHAGIALVVDKGRHLIGTITDGDVRRAILNKIPFTTTVKKLLEHRSKNYSPTVAKVGTSHEKLLELMAERVLRQIPVLDNEGRVVELVLLSELIEEELHSPLTAMVMAGGRGERLYPLTKDIPKSMLPLESRPIMERTIEQLREAGITKVNIALHYKPDIITNHFGNGDTFGVDINYINEDQPLGTAGALGLMEVPEGATLVVNGDIVTQLDFQAMYDFHRVHQAVMTVGVRKCEFEIPYGVIELDDVEVKDIVEKPQQTFIVNAGIYLLDPITYRYIPKNRHFDMTDLVSCLIKSNHKVICFPIQEYWLDIGQPDHYQQAKEDIQQGRV